MGSSPKLSSGGFKSHPRYIQSQLCACLVTQLCPTLCNPNDCSPQQAPLIMEFPRQEYWSGLPHPPPGDLPDPGIESVSPMSPALQVGSLPLEPPGKS